MACNCGNKRAYSKDPMGGYKYLRPNQVKARLEIFKKNNCQICNSKDMCDYVMWVNCKTKINV